MDRTITPESFNGISSLWGDSAKSEKIRNEYVKNDRIQSYFAQNIYFYNFDLSNTCFEKCHGDLEIYVAHPYSYDLDISYSEYSSMPLLYRLAFYIKNAKILYDDEMQDYEEEIVAVNYWSCIRTLFDNDRGYVYLSQLGGTKGGIIVECDRTTAFELAEWIKAFANVERGKFDISRWSWLREKLKMEAENAEGKDDNNNAEESVSGKIEDELPTATSEHELQEMIGMEDIKQDVKRLVQFVKMQKTRKEKGLKMIPLSLHLVFTGNPGTGKTSVARIIAKIYKEIGILSKGQLIEVDRSGLVAGYVGQTAIKTQEKIDEAIGGILFIDEAYTLAKGGNDYGQEAIDTILKAMEDYRENFVVIVAGYPELMSEFINSNPGLKSRFNKYFHFPDYNENELVQIFYSMCHKYDYIVDENAKIALRNCISDLIKKKTQNFANAREVRNLFETIVSNQASRIAEENIDNTDELMMIKINDLPMI
jgi:AAA+ superfamily predicted ATPase